MELRKGGSLERWNNPPALKLRWTKWKIGIMEMGRKPRLTNLHSVSVGRGKGMAALDQRINYGINLYLTEFVFLSYQAI